MSQPISSCRKQLINSGSAQINSKLNSSNSLYRLYFSQCCIKTFFFMYFFVFFNWLSNMWIFIYLKSSFTWMFIWTQFIDQLPVGLLAQLLERCTSIAGVMGSNPVRAWIFFRPFLQLLVSVVFLTARIS